MKSIQVLIDETGAVEIEAIGFKGNACEKATAGLEKALGVVRNKKKKPEFHQEEKPRVQQGN